MEKVCNHCKKKLSVDRFYKSKSYKDGYCPRCKDCEKKIKHKYIHNSIGRDTIKKYRQDPHYKKIHNIGVKKYRDKYPEKYKAYKILQVAVRNKTIIVPEACHKCDCRKKLEAHHHDYSKPLDVLWVCCQCHKNIHKGEEDAVKTISEGCDKK